MAITLSAPRGLTRLAPALRALVRGTIAGEGARVGEVGIVLAGDAELRALNRRWLRLKLVGKKSNRDAIGAWVRVKVGDQLLARQIMPTRSYLSQSELPVTIGLGTSDKFDDLEVAWPGGQVQKVTQARVNSLTVVEQTP